MIKEPPKTNTCQNCHEKGCELEEIEIVGEKKQWCDACVAGYNLEHGNNRSQKRT